MDPQPKISLAVKVERMQVLDCELLWNDAQTSVAILSKFSYVMLDFHVHFVLTRSCLCVVDKKRPRKLKGAPADDVVLAELRPRHSHTSGDLGGRDVIMFTEEHTHVGSGN
jgi:hypothetical protein